MMVDIPDVVKYANVYDHRLRGFWVAGGQISPSPIDFHRRPYNTLALPCERVICQLYRHTSVPYNSQIERNLCVTHGSWVRRTSLHTRCRHHICRVLVYTDQSCDTGTDRRRHDTLHTVTTQHTNRTSTSPTQRNSFHLLIGFLLLYLLLLCYYCF